MPRLSKEVQTLLQQIAALESIIALQNGAMDEIGKIVEMKPGGAMAAIATILERHGVTINHERYRPLQ